MFNPINIYMDLALPKDEAKDKQDSMRERAVAFFTLFGLIAAVYSFVKWYKNGVPEIAYGALVMIIGAPAIVLFIRFRTFPSIVTANLAIFMMAVFCAVVIYQLGAIHSAHIFWPVGIVIFAYLLTGPRSANVWAVLSTLFLLSLIILDRSGYSFPVHALNEKQALINDYSGFLLPMFLICFAQAYSMNLRQQSLDTISESLKNAEALSRKSTDISEKMSKVLEQANRSSVTLLGASEGLISTVGSMSQKSQDICNGVEVQAKASTEINLTLAEVSNSVEASAEDMFSVSSEINHAEANVSKSAQAMEQAIKNMERIKDSNIGISAIMKVITDIADQTNLLALNAAIEAARAGDQGRGFAIVADEVRSLSIKSNQATQQIGDLLNTASVDVKDGVEAVNLAGEVLSSVVPVVKFGAEQISNIADRTKAQCSQIENAVKQSEEIEMTSLVNEEAGQVLLSGSDSLSNIATELSDIAKEMHALVKTA
jgi:Methyl-accepting chemotaxis protein (MCP) signalling domain